MFSKTNLFDESLSACIAHDGAGEILTSRILTSSDCDGACHFIDYTEMPPGTSIGLHTHKRSEEEYYLVLNGCGTMESNGEVFSVKPGDLIRNPPGGQHGLKNTGDEVLRLFVFELAVTE